MSKVKLLSHNQITFEKILELSKTHNKICVPQATGTGKTYLEAKIVEEWSDKNVIIFAPRNEILDETKNTFKEDCGIDEINTITYQTFNNMTEEEIIGMDLDVILFDEAHRLLAPEWSKKIQVLIDSHPQSLIFGLTATPIRADGRDIREEIFDNCSTHYITLEEAIVRDIVKMPIYVSALYTFDEVLEDMQYKIENSKNSKDEKAELKKRVKVAKNNLELSMGVPTIIKKYISDYNGKYLVFCRDTVHLEESILLVNRWFGESGYKDEIVNYRIGSNYSDSNKQLEMFKKDNSNRLKLLFSIEKLNEGVHIPTVDGVILLRPTSSNIIYYQQIGRCIRADANKRPVILDLVNNMNGIKIPLQDGIKKCIEVRKNGGYPECSNDIEIDNYSIIDYLHETASVFSEIENDLILDKWKKWEDDILFEIYPEGGADECIKRLPHRSKNAIIQRANSLRLVTNKFKKITRWSKENINYLLENYENPEVSLDEIERNTGMKNSQIRTKASELGLKRVRGILTKEIIDCIEKEYSTRGAKYISEKYNISTSAIYCYVSKNRIKWKGDLYTDEIDNTIKDLYPQMGGACAKFINGLTPRQVRSRARKLGVECNKNKKYKYVYKTRNRYEVKFTIDGKDLFFGSYDNEDEAGRIALEKAKEYSKI